MSKPNLNPWLLPAWIAIVLVITHFAKEFAIGVRLLLFAITSFISIQYLWYLPQPLHTRPKWWAQIGSPHMSRTSLVINALLAGLVAAAIYMQKPREQNPIPLMVIFFMFGVHLIARWRDTGKWK